MSFFYKMEHFPKIHNSTDFTPPKSDKPVFLDVKPKNVFDIQSATDFTRYNEENRDYPKLPIKAFSLREDLKIDIVYENTKPVYTVLRILGVLPFTIKAPGVTKFILSSPSMMYSLFAFIALMLYACYILITRINVVRSLEGRFEEAVIAYLFIVNIFPISIVPIMWYETGKVAKVLNSWTDFEILYNRISGRPLALKMRPKALKIAIFLPIVSTLSVVITHVTMVDFRIEQVIPYCILDTLTYMMGGYWYLACETLSSSANILADDFQRALRHIGPAALVSDYRSLWLRLSKLARNTGTATCYTFTFISLYLFFIITLSIYGLMSQLSDGFGIKDIGLAVTAFCSIALLFFICDEAHYASWNVRTNFQKKLLMVELSWMNADAQTEINMFLRATELNPSNINLGGFFDVNRNLFKSLLATMVTYLVVLLQFQISIPVDTDMLLNPNITKTLAM